jgi:hypothetical protein
MKKLRNVLPTVDEVKAQEDLSVTKIKQRAERKIEKKIAAKKASEPSFRIEDKKIIISFSE